MTDVLLIQLVWALWISMGLFSWLNVVLYYRKMVVQDRFLATPPSEGERPAVVIVPIKGAAPDYHDFIARLLRQDYSQFRIIFAMEARDDPAVLGLQAFFNSGVAEGVIWSRGDAAPEGVAIAPGLESFTIVISGISNLEGQKIFNQRAAWRTLTDADELVVFADADMLCPDNWMTRLLAPINLGTHDASTGYRWLVPERQTIPNILAAVINASVATLGGPEWSNLCWGGSMAYSRETAAKIDLDGAIAGALDDDLRIAMAVRRAGLRIAFVRSLMLPSPTDVGWMRLMEFARRQYFHVRFNARRYWYKAFTITGTYVTLLGITLSMALFWPPPFRGQACIVLVSMFGFDVLRAISRRRIIRYIFRGEALHRLRLAIFAEYVATGIWMTVHFVMVVSAGVTSRVHWAGVAYSMHPDGRVRRMRRLNSVEKGR